jgi:hypothetical protein
MSRLEIKTTDKIIEETANKLSPYRKKWVSITSLTKYLDEEHYANATQKYCVTCKILNKITGAK